MAYDYLTWISLKRPLTEKERSRRIDVRKPVATDAADAHTVFSMDDTVLEVCDGAYFQQGWALFAFIIGFPLLFFLAVSTAISAIDVPAAITRNGDQFWFSVTGWIEAAIAFAGCAVTAFFLRQDCFNYRHKSVRFNRKTRMVYAFRHNGPGGVIQVPWDSAFFYPHRKASNRMLGGAPTIMRCLVLDEADRVINTFSFGARVVNSDTEDTDYGRQVLYQVQANFELIRRYMESGPASIPAIQHYLPKGPSLRASLSAWFFGVNDIGQLGHSARLFTFVLSGPLFVMAILHYIAQLTSREPVWPAEIEAACGNAQPTVATVA